MWDVSGELLDILSKILLSFVPALVKQRFPMEGAVKGCLKQGFVNNSLRVPICSPWPLPLYPRSLSNPLV